MIRLFLSFYVMLFLIVFTHGEFASQHWIREMVVKDKTKDDIGLFYLVEQLQQNLDEKSFNDVIANYPRTSNMPIQILENKGFETEDGSSPFDENNIYIADPNENMAFYKLENIDAIVRVGPTKTYQPLLKFSDVYDRSIYYLVVFLTFLWMLNLQRKLNKLNKAAIEFGEGDLETKVSEKMVNKIGDLNQSFNSMAYRIKSLLVGHKDLTNAVAHELRTPLARVRFQLDLMYQEKDELLRKEYIHGISDDIEELSALVDEILNYARLEQKNTTITKSEHSLDVSLNNVIKARLFDSNHHFQYDNNWCQAEPNLQYLNFDLKSIERALGNLLSNAEKYATSQIQISVELQKDKCLIFIDDDGKGIAEKDRECVFMPFKRLDNSRTKTTGGYGLGMAIVKQIIQLHGGIVFVEQAPIGGARFVVQLPID